MARAARRWTDPPEGRSRIWRGIRYLKEFTLEEVMQVSGEPPKSVHNYVPDLLRAGYLRLVHRANTRKPGDFNRYRLIRDTGSLAPMPRLKGVVWDPNQEQEYELELVPNHRDQAWAWIRSHLNFTVPDLVAAGVERKNAQKFVSALNQADYLTEVLAANGRIGQSTVYMLKRNSGLLTPVVQRDGSVWDPNLDQVFGRSGDGVD